MTSGISSLSSGMQIYASQRSGTTALGAIEEIAGFGAGSAASGAQYTTATSGSDNAVSFSEQLSEAMRVAMLQFQESDDTDKSDGLPDARDMFANLDSDGDGLLSKEEFLAGKPDGVSDEQAENLWNRMAGDDATSIGENDFLTAMALRPPAAASSDAAEEDSLAGLDGVSGEEEEEQQYHPLDIDRDGTVSLVELLTAQTTSATLNPADSTQKQGGNNSSAVHLDNRLMAQLMSTGGMTQASNLAAAA
ncbi:hypothetical protein [Thalassospira sp.]|uniref:hypothetical protein n=1 Tax=Thalassospira sp. TaxID=1912094 RepID=UPI0027349766|nr:hypothetical protein [Thalassospira sp.]MDP2698606.1 hypothetical protein [Thalassospira sp.]